jgi:dTDP-4-amino-4,6-dideoxygalactose transaminase
MNRASTVPFLDLVTPHRELEEELVSVFRSTLATAGFIGGPMVEEFEREFARFCDMPYCVGVGSGTDALRFSLMAAGIGSGNIVLTVPNTFIATTEAISQTGAQVGFIDVDESTYNMDAVKLQEYLETECQVNDKTGVLEHRKTQQRVAAVIPVHLYGQMADMDAILEHTDRFGLRVIEDACQAHGARYFSKRDSRWHKAGSMASAAAFSFYPGKNLGACGEAGAVTTKDESLAARIRMIRDHGQAKKYYHDIEGYNGRLDALQAGFLRVKLQHLARWNEQRRERATEYKRLFEAAGIPIDTPSEPSWSRAVYHLYVVRTQHREEMMAHLGRAGIGTGIHYPIPLHLQKAYARFTSIAGHLPVSEKVAAEIVSLPMFPHLTAEQQARVVTEVSRFAGSRVVSAPAIPGDLGRTA